MTAQDTVLRALTDDGAFRVIAARTTDTVRGVLALHGGNGASRELADLVTGVVLVRETMAPTLRVQGILRDTGGRTLVADSHPSGSTRGLSSAATETPKVTPAILKVLRTMHDGRLQTGIVEVPDPGGVSKALMEYMQSSEQLTAMISLGTVFDGDEIVSSGGYLVQLLPEVSRGPLMVMTERLEDYRSIQPQLARSDFAPAALLEEILYAMPFTKVGESEIRCQCWCDRLRVLSALTTLPRTEIREMTQDGKPLEISCDYCGREYAVTANDLEGLLAKS